MSICHYLNFIKQIIDFEIFIHVFWLNIKTQSTRQEKKGGNALC